tara:strand:- start:630 stop:863 length:234 start_codon:yes stop_codon:yes gene_type:complete
MYLPVPDVLTIVINNALGFIVQRVLCRGIDTYSEYREEQIRLEPIREEYRALPRVVSMESSNSTVDSGWIHIDSNHH